MKEPEIPSPTRDQNHAGGSNLPEERLKEQQKRFDFAELISHFGSGEWYIRTGKMFWSNELFRILGFEPGSFLPTYEHFKTSIHPMDLKDVLDAMQKTFHDNVPFHQEFRIIRPDKSVRDVLMIAEVFRDDGNQPLRMNGSIQDITERRQMERKLEHQNEELLRFSAVLDGMEDIVIITGYTGLITYVNRVGEKTLGYSTAQLTGKHISELKSPDSQFELRKEVFIDSKSTWTGNLNLRNKHGVIIRTSLKSTPIMKERDIFSRAFVLRVLF